MTIALTCLAAAGVLAFLGAPLFVWTLAVGGLLAALYGLGAVGPTALVWRWRSSRRPRWC